MDPLRAALLGVALAVAGALSGCGGIPSASVRAAMSAEDVQLAHKFRGIRGGELYVDAIEEVQGVNILNQDGGVIYASATVSIFNQSRYSYSSDFGMPKTIRVVWRDRPEPRPADSKLPSRLFVGGTVLGDYTVPVASRVPDEVLDAVRARRGQLRLKIRIHPDGPLVGWDVLRVESGRFETDFAGGDFREARLRDGQVVRKGWYIHPKTQEKIETDY